VSFISRSTSMRSVHPNLDTSISSSVNDNGKRHNLDIQVSQDSVATCLRCDEDFVAMLLLSSTVKEVYKSAKDCQSRVAYFFDSRCISQHYGDRHSPSAHDLPKSHHYTGYWITDHSRYYVWLLSFDRHCPWRWQYCDLNVDARKSIAGQQ